MPNQFKIYSSSAGSGKTYTLTKEYLKLALSQDNPHYFKHILAITFTNDAANEMKERIVKALKGFAFPEFLTEKEQKNSTFLLESIVEETQQDPAVLKTRAEKTFSKILYNYADFAVSTIDSFVNKIISVFTRELDIPYNYEVDLDTKQLLEAAVDRVLDKVGQEHKGNLSEFVVDWVQEKAEEGKNWGKVASDLVEFAQDLMNENAYAYIDKLRILDIRDYKTIHQKLLNFKEKTEAKVLKIAQEGYKLIKDKHINIADFANGKSGVGGYFKKHADKLTLDLTKSANSFVKKAVEDNRWTKGNKANPAIDEIKEDLASLVEEIESIKEKDGQDYLLITLILPHIYKLALIKEIEQELVAVKRENNAIHISDTGKRISEIISSEPVPYIYERVGEKYNHILIDEFQDTSVLQWENLLPLVENNLSEGKFNLIVGDAKQAIYRWRGGEMEQLVYLYKNKIKEILALSQEKSPFLRERYQMLEQNFEPANLNYNFRSTQEVIAFNNDFFAEIVKSDFGKKYPLLSDIYDDTFVQKIPENNPKTGGQVQIDFVDKSELYEAQVLDKVLTLIEKVESEGFEKHDIAILVRGNNHGKTVANFLRENNIEVISQTSLLLASDEKVRFVLAILRVLYKPEDKLARSEALYLFYKVVLEVVPDTEINETISEVINSPIIVFYQKLEEENYPFNYIRWQALNLYELAEKIIGSFDLLSKKGDLAYLFRFLDVILQFKLQKNATLNDFLDYWEEKKGSLSINTPKGKGAITVTTIHKSKGLEYPVVILAFADWNFVPKTPSTLWINLEKNPSFDLGENKMLQSALVSFSSKLENTSAKEAYEQENEKTFIENINLLYVAFTRAVEGLYIISKKDTFDKKGGQKGVNFLIYLYLLQKNLWREEEFTYLHNPPKSQKNKQPYNHRIIQEEEVFYIDEIISTDKHKKIRIRGKR